MNYSEEYISFLEAHRRTVEYKDKLKQATIEAYEKKLVDLMNERLENKQQEAKINQ